MDANANRQRFEAAWCGDLDTIKSLTLSKWGPQNNQLPLQIAVEDKQDFSPFSIAVLRGHLQVARSILRIVEAQYKPRGEETAERYRLDEDLDIYSEIIDEKYTIDNIGEVAAEVECNVAPLTVLQWDCPVFRFIQDFRDDPDRPRPRDLMEYAVYNDNVELLAFLLELGQDIRARGDPEKSVYRVPRCTFDKALRLGRVRCLAEIIRRTGGDLPIKDLVRRSGVQIQEKPKYYQGLTIHGKKRPDWASEGRGHYRADRTTSPPLLNAAFAGSLESTEWFLGTSPGRCYNEFTERYKHDKRLQILAQSKLGVEGSVMKWLGSRSKCSRPSHRRSNSPDNLVLHCAVLSRETDESERLVQYLAKEYPSCLEAKSVEGYTPLQLALSLKSQNFARILINAGANQAIRDATGRNLIHIILCGTGGRHTADANTVRKLVGLLDLRLVPSMLTERCSQSPGSLTPMAHWMANGVNKGRSNYRSQQEIFDLNNEYNQNIEITRIMLDLAERTGQKHLELLNGAGSTPVHDAVKYQTPTIFRMMVDRRPDLLHREDSTGCTPVELAANLWVNEVTSNPPRMPGPRAWWRGMEDGEDVLNRSPESFVEDKKRTTERQDIYDACRERATSSKRKLVTLYEANEVANRLAAQQRFKKRHSRATGDENEESETDEVKMWHARF